MQFCQRRNICISFGSLVKTENLALYQFAFKNGVLRKTAFQAVSAI